MCEKVLHRHHYFDIHFSLKHVNSPHMRCDLFTHTMRSIVPNLISDRKKLHKMCDEIHYYEFYICIVKMTPFWRNTRKESRPGRLDIFLKIFNNLFRWKLHISGRMLQCLLQQWNKIIIWSPAKKWLIKYLFLPICFFCPDGDQKLLAQRSFPWIQQIQQKFDTKDKE